MAIFLSDLSYAMAFEISKAETSLIAQRIFNNECDVEKDCLIQWNVGEDFLSLGLGHFIWYPGEIPGIFHESFRSYLQYARENGEDLPAELDKTPFPACPWLTRKKFLNSKDGKEYKDILDFMTKTKDCQADYLIENAKRSLPRIISAASQDQRSRIAKYLFKLTGNAQGLYAIIDYINFKGSGIIESERYHGQGWGLLQVLQGMRDMPSSQGALEEFVRSAKEVLKRRVANAPIHRYQAKWLPGWLHRVDTYCKIRV